MVAKEGTYRRSLLPILTSLNSDFGHNLRDILFSATVFWKTYLKRGRLAVTVTWTPQH